MVEGRLYGPALFPQALAGVRGLAQAGVPVIGAGGVYSQAQAQAMLAAGALAVQLDAVLWRGNLTQRLLLGDAVDVTPAQQNLAGGHANHLPLGQQFLQRFQRLAVVRSRQNCGTIAPPLHR